MDAIVYDKVGKEAEKVREALYGIYPQETITDAAVASFDDGADGIPVKALTVGIELVQAGSGDPSPDNVKPITGWTGAKVTRTGKNLAYLFRDGTVPSINNGMLVPHNSGIRSNFIPFNENTAFTFSISNNFSVFIMFYDSNKNFINYYSGTSIISATSPTNTAFVMLRADDTSASNIQFVYGSTTEYEPYQGQTYGITLPTEAETVYGATMTLNPDRTGTLVVDRAFNEYDGSSDEIWFKEGSGENSYFRIAIGEKGAVVDDFAISNLYTQGIVTGSTNYVGINVINSSAYNVSQIVVRPQNISAMTLDDFRAQLAITPLQVVYKLASSQTYQLTESEISDILTTIYGTNNIWVDCGDIEKLTYRADLGKYIDSHITTVVANALNA